MKKVYFIITAFIFGAVAALHLLRIIYGWTVVLGPWIVPLWFSWLGVILAGGFLVWALCIIKDLPKV